jgi:TatD DNase family protein
MLTDVHAHLSDCADDALGALIEEAAAAGVGTIVNNALSIDTAITVLEQCRRFPQNLKAAVGVSPFDTVHADDDWADKLKELLAESSSMIPVNPSSASTEPSDLSSDLLDTPAIAAVGEIGLDCTNPRYPPLDVQMPFFVKQLEIAIDADLPAVIHSRGMEKRTAEICHQHGVKKAVFHCFTGDREALEYITGCGYYISISGIITFNNSQLRNTIQYLPIDKMLIETDAPYLSPVPHRGKPNRPAYLIHTAQEIAKLLCINDMELADKLRENTRTIFGF